MARKSTKSERMVQKYRRKQANLDLKEQETHFEIAMHREQIAILETVLAQYRLQEQHLYQAHVKAMDR